MVLRVLGNRDLDSWFADGSSSAEIAAIAAQFSGSSIILTAPRTDLRAELSKIENLHVRDAVRDFYAQFARAKPNPKVVPDRKLASSETWNSLRNQRSALSLSTERLKVRIGSKRNEVFSEVFQPLASLAVSVSILDAYAESNFQPGRTWFLEQLLSATDAPITIHTTQGQVGDFSKRRQEMLELLEKLSAHNGKLTFAIHRNSGDKRFPRPEKVLHERAFSFKFDGPRKLELTSHIGAVSFSEEVTSVPYSFTVKVGGETTEKLSALRAGHGHPELISLKPDV